MDYSGKRAKRKQLKAGYFVTLLHGPSTDKNHIDNCATIRSMTNHTANFHKFKDALRHALSNYSDKRVKRGEALHSIARSLIHVAINGSERDKMGAIKELADRLDGKAVQAIAGPDGEQITIVQRVIVQQVAEEESADPAVNTLEHLERGPKLIN